MATKDLERLLRWYPPAWRDRYADEIAFYMEDRYGPGRLPLAARLSLAFGASISFGEIDSLDRDDVASGMVPFLAGRFRTSG